MLFFERYGEAVYDTAQYLEELCNAIKLFYLINETKKYIVYLLSNECTQAEKFSVNAM
jgi:hypothetical protein